jgi:ABC-type transport system involved in cytochrome bd biosynthesis fused ATPase/permease subunit
MQAVARAIYSRKEMIFLDDVMSGLDASTEDILFNNLFGEKGLLRASGTTVVFATNAGTFQHSLTGIKFADTYSSPSFLRPAYHCSWQRW